MSEVGGQNSLRKTVGSKCGVYRRRFIWISLGGQPFFCQHINTVQNNDHRRYAQPMRMERTFNIIMK